MYSLLHIHYDVRKLILITHSLCQVKGDSVILPNKQDLHPSYDSKSIDFKIPSLWSFDILSCLLG